MNIFVNICIYENKYVCYIIVLNTYNILFVFILSQIYIFVHYLFQFWPFGQTAIWASDIPPFGFI